MSDVELAEAAAANKKSGLRFQRQFCVPKLFQNVIA
jgi:hypothetical protein